MAGIIENAPRLGQALLKSTEEQSDIIPVRFSFVPPLVQTPLVTSTPKQAFEDRPLPLPRQAFEDRPLPSPRQAFEDRPGPSAQHTPPRQAFEERQSSAPRQAFEDKETSTPRHAFEEKEDDNKDRGKTEKTLPQVSVFYYIIIL